MNKFITNTLIASGVAFSAFAPLHAAEPAQGKAQSQPKSTVGQYVDDSTITAKVKAAHAEDKVVSALRVNVETKQGVVVLTGETKSDAEKQRAEAIAMRVLGVKGVSNMIDVKPNS
jgi:hyperosmotically inducible periplasmic protein